MSGYKQRLDTRHPCESRDLPAHGRLHLLDSRLNGNEERFECLFLEVNPVSFTSDTASTIHVLRQRIHRHSQAEHPDECRAQG